MRKVIFTILLCSILGVTACGTMKTQEAQATVTEVTSEPGEVSFTLTEEWAVQRAEELAETMNLKSGQTYDLLAQNTETGTNINIIYEDLTQTEGGTLVRMDDYVTAIRESLNNSSDYTYNCTEAATQELDGEEYYVFQAEVTVGGQQGTQYFYIRRIDDTMMIMTISLFGEDSIESLLEL